MEGVFIGEEGVEHDVGEAATEQAEGFASCVACRGASFDVGAGEGGTAGVGVGEAVQGGVDLAIPAPVEAEPLVVP